MLYENICIIINNIYINELNNYYIKKQVKNENIFSVSDCVVVEADVNCQNQVGQKNKSKRCDDVR